jgi:hypothetical protein
MITFITYNQALMWSRLEQIIMVSCAAAMVVVVEVGTLPITLTDILSGNIPENMPYPIFSLLASTAAQIWALKCWADMILKGQPDKNCWEFKE